MYSNNNDHIIAGFFGGFIYFFGHLKLGKNNNIIKTPSLM